MVLFEQYPAILYIDLTMNLTLQNSTKSYIHDNVHLTTLLIQNCNWLVIVSVKQWEGDWNRNILLVNIPCEVSRNILCVVNQMDKFHLLPIYQWIFILFFSLSFLHLSYIVDKLRQYPHTLFYVTWEICKNNKALLLQAYLRSKKLKGK